MLYFDEAVNDGAVAFLTAVVAFDQDGVHACAPGAYNVLVILVADIKNLIGFNARSLQRLLEDLGMWLIIADLKGCDLEVEVGGETHLYATAFDLLPHIGNHSCRQVPLFNGPQGGDGVTKSHKFVTYAEGLAQYLQGYIWSYGRFGIFKDAQGIFRIDSVFFTVWPFSDGRFEILLPPVLVGCWKRLSYCSRGNLDIALFSKAGIELIARRIEIG